MNDIRGYFFICFLFLWIRQNGVNFMPVLNCRVNLFSGLTFIGLVFVALLLMLRVKGSFYLIYIDKGFMGFE